MTEKVEPHYERIEREEWILALVGNVEAEALTQMIEQIDALIDLGLVVHYLYDDENGTATYTATTRPRLGFYQGD